MGSYNSRRSTFISSAVKLLLLLVTDCIGKRNDSLFYLFVIDGDNVVRKNFVHLNTFFANLINTVFARLFS
jgi:hypothetical protein